MTSSLRTATGVSAACAPPTGEELDGFRSSQRIAYECTEAVAATLRPGVTEKHAAHQMRRWLEERGVHDWFHQPFVWFGDRTAFVGFRVPLQFFPTNRRLEEGMPFILDCAPVMNGYTSDVGYSGCLGANPVFDVLMDGLAEHRSLVLSGVRSGRTLRDIYDDVDRLLATQGFDNRHRRYPFGVIAHRVDAVPEAGPAPVIARFGLNNLRNLGRDIRAGRRQGWSPLWGPYRSSDHGATPGLWAVEPHLGFRGVGAKFEELLVVTRDDAFWLDDDVPHVRRWRRVPTPAVNDSEELVRAAP
ncbi:MAG: aminopeptidase P family protein [Actinobacteria bacterium]|nr:aminopeptidase P family protein [Actinomycetota bacterium]